MRPVTTGKGVLQLFSLILLFAIGAPCTGEVYRWKDEAGKTHYGAQPGPGAVTVPIDLPPPPRSATSSSLSGYRAGEWHRVIRVYDGDTITLDNGEKIRLLGINTPEVGGFKPLEAGGLAARDWLREKILDKPVRVELDAEPRDKYKRLLANLFDESGLHLNLELVRLGLATTDIYPPSLKYSSALMQAEREAEQQHRGLWALDDHQAKPAEDYLDYPREGWHRFKGTALSLIEGHGWSGFVLKGGLEVHIPEQNLQYLQPLESYLGKNVEVRGWFSMRGNGHSITVRHPSALLVF